MKNFKYLELVSDRVLYRIVDLDKVDNLEKSIIYGNYTY